MYLETYLSVQSGDQIQVCLEYELARKDFNPNCTIFDIEIIGVEAFNEVGIKLDFVSVKYLESGSMRDLLVKKAHEVEIEKRA